MKLVSEVAASKLIFEVGVGMGGSSPAPLRAEALGCQLWVPGPHQGLPKSSQNGQKYAEIHCCGQFCPQPSAEMDENLLKWAPGGQFWTKGLLK